MKKIFALALAALMTAGMTTVAFAATTAEVNLAPGTDTSMFVMTTMMASSLLAKRDMKYRLVRL